MTLLTARPLRLPLDPLPSSWAARAADARRILNTPGYTTTLINLASFIARTATSHLRPEGGNAAVASHGLLALPIEPRASPAGLFKELQMGTVMGLDMNRPMGLDMNTMISL
jgi:hypothetical protein